MSGPSRIVLIHEAPMITSSRRASARRTSRRGVLSAALALAVAAPAAVASTAASAAPTGGPDRAAVGYLVDVLDGLAEVPAGAAADVILAAAAAGSGADAAAATFADIDGVDGLEPGIVAKVLLAAGALDEADGPTATDAEDALREAIVAEGEAAGRVGTSTQLFTQSLAILALSTTDEGAPAATVDFLVDNGCDDGGFVFGGPTTCGDASDVDATAVAIQALLAAERDADAADAVAWLVEQQDDATGGFASSGLVNSNSSALAAQTLRAVGETAAADEAAAYVATLFEGCDAAEDVRGSYRFTEASAGSRTLATSQAVFATAPTLDQLSFDGATAATERLNCADTFCPPDTGISVAVDLTTLDPDADVDVRCATDLPADPDGIDVLRAAGFDITTQDSEFGEFVCTIEGFPELPEGECFADDGFFGYYNAPLGGDWTSYQVGASGSSPQVGTIEGWAWAPDFVGVPPRVSTTPAATQPDPGPDPEPTPTPPFDRGLDAVCPGTYDNPFTDLPGDSVHLRAITCLSTTPIVQGTGDGSTFSPANDVTRDQIASLLARGIEQATGTALPTGDVRFDDSRGSVHSDAIHALASAGIIRGTGDGSSFSPREPLERQQMATLLDRMLDFLDDGAVNGSFPPAATTTGVFTDEASAVHAPAIDRLANLGVVTGRADGTFGPRLNVRRDQVVSFVARALDVAVDEGFAPPVTGG